ncbi:hypothetical protein CGK05_24145, partial [Vibrio parahaemolyticus]
KSNADQTRIVPQVQNSNQQDYFWVLNQAGVLKEADYPSNAGNRRIVRAFRHFCSRIEEYLQESSDRVSALTSLIEKVNTAT